MSRANSCVAVGDVPVAPERVERRLAAILVADVVGYLVELGFGYYYHRASGRAGNAGS